VICSQSIDSNQHDIWSLIFFMATTQNDQYHQHHQNKNYLMALINRDFC